MAIALSDIKAEHFTDLVGSSFHVVATDRQLNLTLDEVVCHGATPVLSQFRAPFILIFSSPCVSEEIGQSQVTLEHDQIGALSIVVSPLDRKEDGTIRYQAIFC